MSATTAAERAEMRAMAHQLARSELEPRAMALDAGDETAMDECWRLVVDTGLDRALLAEEHGGAGLDALDLLATVEELALGDGGVAMCVLLCNAALATLAGEQLAGLREGERWALAPARAEAELTVSDGRLDGRIACALGAHGADGLVLLIDGGPEPTAWAVGAGARGLGLERDPAQMGLRAAAAASVELQGVDAVPSASPPDGSGAALGAASAHALLRAGTAAIARGIARRAYELAFEYAHDRRQGGVAIVEHDAVSDMLSAMAVGLAFRPEIAACSSGMEIGRAQALAAKIAATDGAVSIATDAVQVFGGTGYMVETGVEKLMRDAKYCQLHPECNWVAHDELMRLERAGLGCSSG